MTLYNSHTDFTVWRGEPINDVIHPLIIEKLWSDNELENIGLYKESMIVDTPVPEGKVSIGRHVEVIEGVPTWIHSLIDIPEPEPNLNPLDPWQFWAMLRITNNEQTVRNYVDGLPEPQKAIASAQLEYSLEFRRDHPLVENVRTLLEMSETALDTLWDQGHSLTL
jgi:hypothetical protein